MARGAANPERLGLTTGRAHLAGHGDNDYLGWLSLEQTLDYYYKGAGVGNWPIWEALSLRDTGIHIGTSTRNTAGNQVITGVGFTSSVIIFLATDDTGANMNWSVGVDNSTIHAVLLQGTNGTVITINAGYSIYIDRGGGNSLTADVDAIGADGFTLAWVLFGACVVDFIYLCLP